MRNKYYTYFNFYDIEKEKGFDRRGLTLLNHFKVQQQSEIHTCGPCCALAVLNYYGDTRFTESDLVKIMNTKPWPYGTSLKDFCSSMKTINDKNHHYQVISSMDFKRGDMGMIFSKFQEFKNFVLKYLKDDVPIIVENVDDGGHYKVLIGYDEDEKNYSEDMLIFADPSDFYDGKEDGYNYFPAEKFFYMWFDARCFREENRMQPFIIIKKLNK